MGLLLAAFITSKLAVARAVRSVMALPITNRRKVLDAVNTKIVIKRTKQSKRGADGLIGRFAAAVSNARSFQCDK